MATIGSIWRNGLAAIGRIAGGGIAAAMLVAATPANAGYFISYDVSLPEFAVDTIVLYQESPNTSSLTWAFDAPTGNSTISDPFERDEQTDYTFLIGLTRDLPFDAPGQEHVVLFTNTAWAQSAQGIAWGTLFNTTLEDQLVDVLKTGFGQYYGPNDPVLDGYIDDLYAFAQGDAAWGPNGEIGFAPGDEFSVIAFSDGSIIGSGVSSLVEVAPVPEPASWAMLIVGFGLVGGAMRRRYAVQPDGATAG